MDDNFHSLDGNNIFSLRNDLEKRLFKTDMRKKLIGGISEDDVNIYIGNVKKQFQQVENELRQYIKDLQYSKDELQNEFENDIKKLAEEKAGLQEALNEALLKSSDNFDACNDKEEIIMNMENKFNSEINDLNQRVADLEELLEQSKNKSNEEQDLREKAEQQIKELNLKISKYDDINKKLELKVNDLEKRLLDNLAKEEKYSKALGFKNELEAIYSKLDDLKEKAELNDYLHQQLENERFRADNAEKDMSRLLESITGLKDKYIKEG